MPHYDPMSDRQNDRRDAELDALRKRLDQSESLNRRAEAALQNLELLRAECNKLAAERDVLEKRVKGLRYLREQDGEVIAAHRRELRLYRRLHATTNQRKPLNAS